MAGCDVPVVMVVCDPVMAAELSSALPVEYCGLDPLFSSSLKLYICDILSMKELDSHSG